MVIRLAAASLAPFLMAASFASGPKHTFSLGKEDFLLDGKPFQIMGGEMHPERIPSPYWRHRIQMAKAMGLNTIALYVFWNAHEQKEGRFDFKTGNLDTAAFVRICQEEGMWVLFRPGPYCCGEWDFGGIPPYLLKHRDLRIRCMDPRYIKSAGRYLARLAKEIKPLQVTQGGPILLVQLENEYGSYSNDREYMKWIHDTWRANGIDIPFYTADGPTQYMLEAGSYPGAAVGLDSGSSQAHWDLAKKMKPGVPIMSSETYPGWLTHWGENWARSTPEECAKDLDWLLENKKSFNLYVFHGGTNFGLSAGANSGGKGYEPDVTSYDYDAPVSEQGLPTPKFHAMREVMARRLGRALPALPSPIPSMEVAPIAMSFLGSLTESLGESVRAPNPLTFEELGQNQGIVEYSTTLIGRRSGTLNVPGLHDWANVFLDGRHLGVLDRRAGITTIEIPASSNPRPRLTMVVEGMGHINFSSAMLDRKGIDGYVLLNGMIMTNWEMKRLDLMKGPIAAKPRGSSAKTPGSWFGGSFIVDSPLDTFLDLSNWTKGYVWVNGNLLGRYWNVGPQFKLYCPAEFMKKGENKVVVLDLVQLEAKPISGVKLGEAAF